VGNNKKSYDLVQTEAKKMANNFTLEYWVDEGWYVGRLKEAPGIFSQGQTLKELKTNILDAYNLLIEEEQDRLPPKIRGKVKQIQVEI
jgi:predicted RNase H-like HicB family nuclease